MFQYVSARGTLEKAKLRDDEDFEDIELDLNARKRTHILGLLKKIVMSISDLLSRIHIPILKL